MDIDIDSVVEAGEWDLQFETSPLLLSLGTTLNARDGRGFTPRDWAAQYGALALEQIDLLVGR